MSGERGEYGGSPVEFRPSFELHDDDPEHLSALEVRDYEKAPLRVQEFYRDNHTGHTYERNRAMWEAYASPEARTMKAHMWEILNKVGELKDASDPDVDEPQIVHAFQSAEAARRDNRPEWFQATVLVHDVGKLLATDILPDRPALPQWAVVGDTFPVGCKFDDRIVLSKYFHPQDAVPDSDDPMLRVGWPGNPDTLDERFNTELGIYHEGVGLDNITVSFGHDEYLYQVLSGNCELPPSALKMIRYHSLYPVHNAGAYGGLLTKADQSTLKGVRHFNQYDLYSKVDEKPDIAALSAYYEDLVNKFFPNELSW